MLSLTVVQDTFGKAFNAGSEFARNGSQFDHLFEEGEGFNIGNLEGHVLHTPGHTPACLTYVIGDAAFCRRYIVYAGLRYCPL